MEIKLRKSYRLTVTLFLALVLTLGFVTDTTKVLAIPDVQYYGGNDILFYDPDAVACAGGSTGGGSLRGKNHIEKIWSFLVDKGLTAEQAAGVMGNMDAESGYEPTRRQGTGDLLNSNYTNNAWGLAQWDGGRRFKKPNGGIIGMIRAKHPELMKYTTNEYGKPNAHKKIPPADLDALLSLELKYLYEESISRRVSADSKYGKGANEWETLKRQKTIEDATVFWHNNFEVSADSAAQVMRNRGGKAKEAYDSFSKLVPAKTGPAASESRSGCPEAVPGTGAGGSLTDLTLKYAWNDYRGKIMERREDYVKAVTTAKGAGKYTGSCNGVDCGAFVTLLVNNSGWDPAYNSSGKGGNTTDQLRWAERNWQRVGNGSKVKVGGDTSNLQVLRPGDVALKHGHTYIFVGKIPGFDSQIASASQCSRAPMAGRESATDSDFTWFRKK